MSKEDIFEDIDSFVVRIAALKSECYDKIKTCTSEYNLEINRLHDELTREINQLKQFNKHLFDEDNDNTNKTKRKSIPKAIKNKCWDVNIGKEKGVGKCCVCMTEINAKHFEAGHIISIKNGGQNNVSNLKPVCEECNKYMGSKNMDEYIKEIDALMK